MANLFNSVEGLHPKRNSFSAHTYRNDYTGSLGLNIPVYIQHVTAATRVKVSTSALVRLQALIAPVMDNIDYYVHFWQIPYRLLENDRFTQFISGEIEPEEYNALFVSPVEFADAVVAAMEDNIDAEDFEDAADYQEYMSNCYTAIFGNGSILDFLGYDLKLFPTLSFVANVPTLSGGNNTTSMNWRELFAYYMLHTNWYMNENVPYFENFVELVDNAYKRQYLPDLATLLVRTFVSFGFSMLPHGWEKDYFTAGLPNVQFGAPVQLPIVGSAPVSFNYSNSTDGGVVFAKAATRDSLVADFDGTLSSLEGLLVSPNGSVDLSKGKLLTSENQTNLVSFQGNLTKVDGSPLDGTADLSEASAITINELRFANALQKFKERQLRFGRRRLEYYKGFFDVVPEDLRLQVPKYLGGGRIPINIADIEQTSQTEGSSALGRLAGKATAVAGGFAGFTTWCSEETVIIGIAFAMPHITYANTVSRFKLKTNDIYDYFNPSFEHLGEQAIKNIELYSGSDNPEGDFAYTPRYTEYRFHANEMHGQFKDTLSFWTLGRIFDSQPALNADFIYMQPKVFDRIFAVANQDAMLVSMLFRQRIVQPVSKYGTPMLLA